MSSQCTLERMNGSCSMDTQRTRQTPLKVRDTQLLPSCTVKIDSLSRAKQQTLMNLSFNIGPHAFEPDSWNSMRETTYCRTMPVNVVGQRNKRRLIEIACGRNSTLSKYAYGNEDCDCVRLTAEDDICWKSTHDKIVAAASSENVLIWISLPCTGGCSYNAKNRRLYVQQKCRSSSVQL